MGAEIAFDEKDFHFLKSVTIHDLETENYLPTMVNFINNLDEKISNGRILVMDEKKPENTKIYSYTQFVEIYDEYGLGGFLH